MKRSRKKRKQDRERQRHRRQRNLSGAMRRVAEWERRVGEAWPRCNEDGCDSFAMNIRRIERESEALSFVSSGPGWWCMRHWKAPPFWLPPTFLRAEKA